MASEDITSRFYYGFTMRTLLGTNCASVLDLGCGTGAFPAYLAGVLGMITRMVAKL